VTNAVTSLISLPEGHEGSVVSLQGGRHLIGRLSALGFTPGALVRVIRNSHHGPIIVSVLDTCIALGRMQADRVMIRPREERS
jgi:ferrous iron transport protein A